MNTEINFPLRQAGIAAEQKQVEVAVALTCFASTWTGGVLQTFKGIDMSSNNDLTGRAETDVEETKDPGADVGILLLGGTFFFLVVLVLGDLLAGLLR
jgi:hypothetical protein